MNDAEARRERIKAAFRGVPVAAPTIVPGGYPVALLERIERDDESALEEVSQLLRDGAIELFRRGRGGMSCTAYVFCRMDPVGSDVRDPLYTTSIRSSEAHDSGAVKDAFGALVHGLAMIGAARAVAFFMEAWLVDNVAERPEGSLEHVPGRKEVVIVTLETAAKQHIWTGEVTRYGGHGFTIAPFEYRYADEWAGRFSGLMKPGYIAAVAAARDET
jgi:hypothetical protein